MGGNTMISKEEFNQRLLDNKTFITIQETIDYRFPVIEYYLKMLSNSSIVINGMLLSSRQINVNVHTLGEDNNFTSLNIAFDGLRKRLNKYG